jgi:hypothetical protein
LEFWEEEVELMVEDAKMATTATLETVRSIALRVRAPGVRRCTATRYLIRLDTQSVERQQLLV